MFVGGLDALKTTTYFTTQHKYAQHNNFKEDPSKIKYKPTYKGAISLFFFFFKGKKSQLSMQT